MLLRDELPARRRGRTAKTRNVTPGTDPRPTRSHRTSGSPAAGPGSRRVSVATRISLVSPEGYRLQALAARGVEDLARDPPGIVGSEKDDDVADVGGSAHATEGARRDD